MASPEGKGKANVTPSASPRALQQPSGELGCLGGELGRQFFFDGRLISERPKDLGWESGLIVDELLAIEV